MAGEKPGHEVVIGPWEQHAVVVLANTHVTNHPSKYLYIYTHRLVLLSALVREASFCSRQ